jgi:ABC-type multidrug transport system ATPase subunit
MSIASAARTTYAAEMAHVTKRYGNVVVLEDLSYAFPSNEIVLVEGESGSGKSTLLRLLQGIEVPDYGDISLLGHPIPPSRSKQYGHLLRQVGIVFQDPLLDNNLTVTENATAIARINGRWNEDKVDDLDLLSFIFDIFEIERFADQPVHQLSGGQKLRVALARALMSRPRWLLLDEPTHMVDPTGKVGIYKQLKGLLEETNIGGIIVSHDIEARVVANNIVTIESGRIV